MRDEHRALILHLCQSHTQRCKLIKSPMCAEYDSIRHPCRGTHLRTCCRELLHQRGTIGAQRIHAHGERRTRIVAVAELLRPLVSVGTHPSLHHPHGMSRTKCKRARIPSGWIRRTLGFAQSRTQNTVDEGIRTPAPVFFREFHRRIACSRGRHAIHLEDLIETET